MHGPESHRPIVPTMPAAAGAGPSKERERGKMPANAMHTDSAKGDSHHVVIVLGPLPLATVMITQPISNYI